MLAFHWYQHMVTNAPKPVSCQGFGCFFCYFKVFDFFVSSYCFSILNYIMLKLFVVGFYVSSIFHASCLNYVFHPLNTLTWFYILCVSLLVPSWCVHLPWMSPSFVLSKIFAHVLSRKLSFSYIPCGFSFFAVWILDWVWISAGALWVSLCEFGLTSWFSSLPLFWTVSFVTSQIKTFELYHPSAVWSAFGPKFLLQVVPGILHNEKNNVPLFCSPSYDIFLSFPSIQYLVVCEHDMIMHGRQGDITA